MEHTRTGFQMTDEVVALGVRGAFATLTGLDNRSYHPHFERYRADLAARLARELNDGTVAFDPILQGFRALHDAVGRSNRRFPSSAESLVSLFLRRGVVPSISPVVDVYNCVSLETRLSLGAHDLEKLHGTVTLGLTAGGERFVPLGRAEPEPVGAGEYGYRDESGEVLCRLEVRQSDRTKLTEASTAGFFLIQGNRATPRPQVESALSRLVALLETFCGGRLVESRVLGD